MTISPTLWQGDFPMTVRHLKQMPAGNDAIFVAAILYKSGRRAEQEQIPFKRFSDGWRHGPLSLADVEQLLSMLDPSTGRPVGKVWQP